jgi:hypothetical protein
MLALCGVGPIHETLIGMVEAASDTKIDKLLERMRALGRTAH